MQFDKQAVLNMIPDTGLRQQAAQQLPDVVDHEMHGDMLQQFGIDPGQMAAQAVEGGGSGQGPGGGQDPGMGGGQDPSMGGGPDPGGY
jgi:hypothetical protein